MVCLSDFSYKFNPKLTTSSFSYQGAIVSAIGGATEAIISAIASIFMIIVSVIVTVSRPSFFA